MRQHLAGEGVSYDGLPEYGHQSGEDVSPQATQKMIDAAVESTNK